MSKYQDVLAPMPERYYRQGDRKDSLILEDLQFIWDMFFKIRPAEAAAFFEECRKRHADAQNAVDPDFIRLPKFLVEKLKLIDRKIIKKAKTGAMVMNMHKNEARKRKRIEIFQAQADSSMVEDKVFLPPDDLTEDIYPVSTKE